MKKNLIVYHRVDYDGIFSCGIFKDFYAKKGIEADIFGWNYGDKPLDIGMIMGRYSSVSLVDISFSPKEMIRLRDTGRVTWIDHHITAITDSEVHGYNNLPGIREVGTAACELCWKYLYPNREVPEIIKILSSYDVWNKTRYNWEDTVLPVQYGLKTRYGIRAKDIFEDWNYIIGSWEDILDDGMAVYSYLKDTWKSWVSNYSFEVTVAGKYRGICILSPMFGSSCFNSVLDKDYEVYIVANTRNGGSTYAASFYKESPNIAPNFSCGEYAKLYGGGGHDSAAGCELTKEQFERLVFNHEI